MVVAAERLSEGDALILHHSGFVNKSLGSSSCVGPGTRYCPRPAGVQGRAWPRGWLATFNFAAVRDRDRKKSGFRDVHASKGSNRA